MRAHRLANASANTSRMIARPFWALLPMLLLGGAAQAGDPVTAAYASAMSRSPTIEQLIEVPVPPQPDQLVGLETGDTSIVVQPSPAVALAAPVPVEPVQGDWLALMQLAPPAVEPAPPLTPQMATFKASLERFVAASPGASRYVFAVTHPRQQRQAILAFYAARGFAPVWTSEGRWTAAAQSVIAVITQARDDGLDLSNFVVPNGADTSLTNPLRSELALSDAVAEYGLQASGGRIDASRLSNMIAANGHAAKARAVLDGVSAAAFPGDALRRYNPQQTDYALLRQKLAELRERAPIARKAIPNGPTLKVGMHDPRVSLIRARFGIGPTLEEGTDNLYDTEVASAVADFQRSKGLPASGILNIRTVAALAGGRSIALQNEILANMERWRWMPRDMEATRIDVNIPEFRLRVYRDNEVVHEARVVVGKPDTPTPLFSDHMRYVTVNPSWWVPQSIIQKELLPRASADPGFLRRSGYEVVRRGSTLLMRQPPGDRNALGHMLFMFPNKFAVYLHDTPSRGLFSMAKRAFSHGCVRVDQPFKLAEVILGAGEGWTEERLHKMMGPHEKTVAVKESIAIHLMYFTARVDGDDRLVMHDDVYGYSKRVRAALGLEG